MNNNVASYNNDIVANFFDFIEVNTKVIFGEKGFFIVFNILNLSAVNDKYERDNGDIILRLLDNSISKVLKQYEGIHSFRFGGNDFIVILPDNITIANKVYLNIEEDFNAVINSMSIADVILKHYIIEYKKPFNSIEDFYVLLFNNINVFDKNEDNCQLIKHIIHTFTSNIRNTLYAYRKFYNLAYTDEVTGIPNNRAGRYFISNLIEEHQQHDKGFSVLFIDGDNLRRYNTLSYEAGNEMIKVLSQIIKNSIRNEDKIFRWFSGDEFLVILKNTNCDDSLKLAERIRHSVESKTSTYVFPTTISIGISHYPSDGSSIDNIIKKAEKANSYAKFLGKNKVIRWDNSLYNNIQQQKPLV